MNIWTIDLSTSRKLRDYYLAEGNVEFANSIEHTESPYEGKTITLLTLKELQSAKKNTPDLVLISVFGEEVYAKDCDEDTRFGYVACGKLVD